MLYDLLQNTMLTKMDILLDLIHVETHFSNNHIAESNKIMEHLSNLSLKLPG